MAGLRRILKMHGRMKVGDVMWAWDYAKDVPVLESEMPEGSERWRESERKKYADAKLAMDKLGTLIGSECKQK